MAGISLSESPLTDNSKSPFMAKLSLGGSSVCVDREQRDAKLYRLLSTGQSKSTTTASRKSSSVDQLPVAKAPSTVLEVLEAMRKALEAEEKAKENESKAIQNSKTTPIHTSKVSMKSASPSSSKSPSQMSKFNVFIQGSFSNRQCGSFCMICLFLCS